MATTAEINQLLVQEGFGLVPNEFLRGSILGNMSQNDIQLLISMLKQLKTQKLQEDKDLANIILPYLMSEDAGQRARSLLKEFIARKICAKSPKSETDKEDAGGGSPMQGHEPSDKPRRLPLQDVDKISKGTAVASTSNTNDGRVQMHMHENITDKAVNEALLVGSSRVQKNLEKPQPNIYHAGSGRGTPIEPMITGPNTNGYGNNDESGFVDHGTTVSKISKGMEELQRNKFMPPGTAVASTSNTNEGRVPEDVKKQLRKLTGSIIRGHVERDGGDELVDLEMGLDPYMMIMYTEAKPKSGIQDIAKVFLAATFTCGIGLANMAKGGSVWGPIYWLAVSAIAIGFLSSLAVILMEEKHPKLATYAAYVMILAISVGFFSAFLV